MLTSLKSVAAALARSSSSSKLNPHPQIAVTRPITGKNRLNQEENTYNDRNEKAKTIGIKLNVFKLKKKKHRQIIDNEEIRLSERRVEPVAASRNQVT
jgi:hypothetical protein